MMTILEALSGALQKAVEKETEQDKDALARKLETALMGAGASPPTAMDLAARMVAQFEDTIRQRAHNRVMQRAADVLRGTQSA